MANGGDSDGTSPTEASPSAERSKPRKQKASSKDARRSTERDGADAPSADTVASKSLPPTTASELKALLQQTLDASADSGDAAANGAVHAEPESPLLVRSDTITPRASPDKTSSAKPTSERRRVSRQHKQTALAAASDRRLSTVRHTAHDATDHADSSGYTARSRMSISHMHISGPRLQLSFGNGCWSRSPGSCMPWGATRLLASCGSLHVPAANTASPPPALSSRAQTTLDALPSIAKKCWIELFLERSDELPFGVYSKPQVRAHLVDRFTGRAIHAAQTSSPAKLLPTSAETNAFKWYHSLRFAIPLVDFVSPHSLLLLEVFEANTALVRKRTRQLNGARFEEVVDHSRTGAASRASEQERRIAWGFYRPVSNRGDVVLRALSPLDDRDASDNARGRDDSAPLPLEANGDGDDASLRIQLHAYQVLTWMDMYQAKVHWQWNSSSSAESSVSAIPAVFLQYQKRRRAVVPTTLSIAIRPIVPPLGLAMNTSVSDAALVGSDQSKSVGRSDEPAAPQDDHSEANNSHSNDSAAHESLLTDGAAIARSASASGPAAALQLAAMSTNDPLIVCNRSATEPCLVPHRVLCRLPTSKKGCSCIAFSPCGLYLAAAISSDASGDALVCVYNVNSSELVRTGRGHRGMIHALEWDALSHHVLSSSSDGTARVWAISPHIDSSAAAVPVAALATWHHTPSLCFVYCGIFHPLSAELALTGASDGLVRFWRVGAAAGADAATLSSTRECVQLCVSKAAAVHSVRIEPKSGRLFCGDGHGIVTVWSASSASGPQGAATVPATASLPLRYELAKTINTGQASVTSLALHPRKQHLLVHTQPSSIFQYELRSYLLLNKSYAGVVCERAMGSSAFSPDGRFVVSSSENGVPLLFASVQGQRFQRGVWGKPFYHECPVTDVSWSPTAHIIAICAYGRNHPIVLLCAHRDDEDAAQHLLATTASTAVATHSSSALMRGLVQERDRANTGAATSDSDHNDRVQRALERRRQRLHAKLTLETETAETAARASV